MGTVDPRFYYILMIFIYKCAHVHMGACSVCVCFVDISRSCSSKDIEPGYDSLKFSQKLCGHIQIRSDQSLSHVQLFATP